MTTVYVPMEVESVRRFDGKDGAPPTYQVFGLVGDYTVSIWMDENEAKAARVASLAK